MNETKVKKPNIAIRLALILLALTCLSVWFTAGMLAKYTAQGSGNDSGRVAKFGVTIDNKIKDSTDAYVYLSENLALSLKPGETQSFRVEVTNPSEVAVLFKVEFVTDGNIPLAVVDGSSTPLSYSGGTFTYSQSLAPNSGSVTGNFTLSMADSSYLHSVGIEALELRVTAQQID